MSSAPPSPSDAPARPPVEAPARRGTRRLRDGSVIAWYKELLAVGILYVVYETIRNLSASGPGEAFANAERVIDFEQATRLWVELPMHEWALDQRWLIIASNYFYGTAYWAVTLFAIIWLFLKCSDDYPLWRNALLVTTGLGLVGFALFPLMPPRLLDGHLGAATFGFVDTLVEFPTFWSFNSKGLETISNQYAAMPSLHCAWALWASCAMFPRVRSWWAKALFLLYPPVQVFCVIVTSNHYVVDALVGFAIVGVGYGVARLVTRAGRRPAIAEQ